MVRRAAWVGIIGALLFTGHAIAGCVGDEPVPVTGGIDAGPGAAPDASANGAACRTGADCASGACADGVCCDQACTGTCESCKIPGAEGTCAPIPDGQDPQGECPTTPLPDDAGASVDDGGDPDAAPDPDAAAPFVLPEAGVTTTDNPCAGKCNGKRACAYAGAERTCGSVFCGNQATQGRASCDGQGHCLFGTEPCAAYACPDGSSGCKTSCAAESDCLPTHFCDAATSTCKVKLGNGSGCDSVVKCQSGFCANNVCCNDACNGYPGAACNVAGTVGRCTCDVCPGGTCQLYYMDEDGDGYGDMNGTLGNGRAKVGCATAPPAGFVLDRTDCWDALPSSAARDVHPNQAAWFASPYTIPGGVASFDYNCNGRRETSVVEDVNATCGFCRASGKLLLCTQVLSKCGLTSTEQQYLNCGFGRACAGASTAFTAVIECGKTGTTTTCGHCASGLITGATTTSGVQQKCH